MSGIGFDCGTFNLVCCRRNENGDFDYRRQVNAFLEMPLENEFVFNMMKEAGVPLIRREDAKLAYALGEDAVKMAYTMTKLELKRPMRDGCVNPSEVDAFQIMNIMIHNLIGPISKDGELLYYSTPANAVNYETDADYHRKLLEAIFKAYRSDEGWTVNARPINEGMALVYAELKPKLYTGIGISFGAGMVNVAFSLYGAEVFTFSLVNSGDWIDRQAAKASGKDIPFINKEKMKIDLSQEAHTLVERAIKGQYELMVEKTLAGIKHGFELNAESQARVEHPIDIVISGGSASPKGFTELFDKLVRTAGLSIAIGDVIRPSDPLFSVARGCLLAAESAQE